MSKESIPSMIRVNQAGEYGACRIYAGQMAVLKNSKIKDSLAHMAEQEQQHLRLFNDLAIEHNIRPTLLQPLWSVGGYALGVVTALLGERAAHACTIAVEEVIADHYQSQLDCLPGSEQKLKTIIKQCRDEEIEHKEHAEAEGGRQAPLFDGISLTVKAISRAAIWLSKRI